MQKNAPPHKQIRGLRAGGTRWDRPTPRKLRVCSQLGSSHPTKTYVFLSRWDEVGPSHPTKTKGFRAGGTRWDRPTLFFTRWDRPTPFGVYKIKKREGWGAGWQAGAWVIAGWSLGLSVRMSSSIVVKPRSQTGSKTFTFEKGFRSRIFNNAHVCLRSPCLVEMYYSMGCRSTIGYTSQNLTW